MRFPSAWACWPLLFCAAAHAQPAAYTPDEHVKNFALSACLAKGFAGTDFARDAGAAAAAYIELGDHGAALYEPAMKLAEQYLAKPYISKQGGVSLITMKCIDLFHSAELQALIEQHQDPSHALQAPH